MGSIMKRMFVSAAAAALIMLSGCAGMQVHRGLDASGAFVSSAAPAVSVLPGEGFSSVTFGRTLCVVPVENGMSPQISTEVWYSLHKNDSSQLAVMLADCDMPCEWNISATGVEYQYKPLLYKFYGERPHDANVLVYTRSVAKDPWMPLFAAAGSAWEGESLIARYEWLSDASKEKIVAEYREPAVALEEESLYPAEHLKGFLQRSQKAFQLAGAPEVMQVSPAPHTNIPNSLLAPVVGSVTVPEPPDFDIN